MSNIEKMLFLNQKFSLLSLKVNESIASNITDSYAYAWYEGVYPFFDDSSEWHTPYKDMFPVSEEMMDDLSKLLDDKWMSKSPITFYELEDHYGVSGSAQGGAVWERVQLVHACRYMYLMGSFDEEFWSTLCENMKCPSEAHSIRREFKPSDIYFV